MRTYFQDGMLRRLMIEEAIVAGGRFLISPRTLAGRSHPGERSVWRALHPLSQHPQFEAGTMVVAATVP
jgi:hypothetical protein